MNENSEYFGQFKWALPLAFSDPLSKCRFERGDMLYDSKKAYQLSWGEAIKNIRYSIQVKFPSTVESSSQVENFDLVFKNNWNSEIEFELVNYENETKKTIRTTQGNLYSFLWTGKIKFIEDTSLIPTIPKLLKDVMKELKSSEADIVKTISHNRNHIFYFPFDLTNSLSKYKVTKIKNVFDDKSILISYEYYEKYPKEIFESSDEYLPTLKYAIFKISGDIDEINLALKEALYVPSKKKKSQKEMFRLKTHGNLIHIE